MDDGEKIRIEWERMRSHGQWWTIALDALLIAAAAGLVASMFV